MAPIDLKTTKQLEVCKAFPTEIQGFYPTAESLLAMTIGGLKQLHLNRIDYLLDGSINSLTFVFSNTQRSPPTGTYGAFEPDFKCLFPKAKIASLQFGSNQRGELNQVKLLRRDGTLV